MHKGDDKVDSTSSAPLVSAKLSVPSIAQFWWRVTNLGGQGYF